MQATVFFDGVGGTCSLPGPAGPTQPTLLPQWVTGQTENLARYVYRGHTNTVYQWSLQFQNLSLANKRELETFFTTIAKGPENQFDYTHTDGNAYTARFIDTQLLWQRESNELWAVNVTLELEESVNQSSSIE